MITEIAMLVAPKIVFLSMTIVCVDISWKSIPNTSKVMKSQRDRESNQSRLWGCNFPAGLPKNIPMKGHGTNSGNDRTRASNYGPAPGGSTDDFAGFLCLLASAQH